MAEQLVPPTPETPEFFPELPEERRAQRRGRVHLFWDAIYGTLRFVTGHVRSIYAAVGIFLFLGLALAIAGTWAFAKVATHVRAGRTQAFDDAVLRYIGANKSPIVERVMFEITFLGTGLVVMAMVAVASLFLWLTRHRHSAALLLVATAGSIVLNNLLKQGFDRPRPQVFTWGQHVVSSSFPSGHAMSAAVVYGMVAYLAARLSGHAVVRALVMLTALALIVLICISRLYLGVHYPSDVFAGVLMGIAWGGLCAAMFEALQLAMKRLSPRALEHERPAPEPDPSPNVPTSQEEERGLRGGG
jgi:undecaprenyl-diphosphatase